MTPLFISFFTTKYADSADELRQTLDAFGLQHDLTFTPSLGDNWTRNVQYKPQFICEQMRKHKGRPLVWVDADARIRRRPELFEKWAADERKAPDFAAHWLGGMELLSGTMWFAPTPAAALLVARWISYQRTHMDMVDQVTLERVLEGAPRKAPAWLSLQVLPASYTAIFDHPGTEPRERVVEHMQLSRKHRN